MKTLVFDFDNIGGLGRLFAIPRASFIRIREDYVNGLHYLECRKRELIIDLPMYADDSFSFDENQAFENAGDGYDITISGVIPKLSAADATVIETLERGQWMVLCQDRNGVVRLCGDENVLLKFISKKGTGAAAVDRNGISFTFSCRQSAPSIYITIDDMSSL